MTGLKKYVAVHVMHYSDGKCCPTVIQVDGEAFLIEKITEIRKVDAQKNLGAEERFSVMIRGQERPLFRENQRWFVVPGARIVRSSVHNFGA